MNYEQTLNYLYTNLPMFSKTGADAYKKDITNTMLLCEFIGDPQNKIKTIHVAGTNGKGSTSHMLAAIFQQAGYRTGLYTSPHLKEFRERIKINGIMIPEDFIVSFVEKIRLISEQIEPSFFELTVAMMFMYFAVEKVDIAIIETGLGGRLDSTNIIQPELSVITNIGYDHMNILGNTLEEIAFEKAGIIKMNTPVVIGETLPETKPIFVSMAIQQEAQIIFAKERFQVVDFAWNEENLSLEVMNKKTSKIENFILDLNGIYQQNNLLTVLTALDVLNNAGYTISDDTIHLALSKVKKLNGLFGRWDVIHRKPMIVLDVAHNEDGIKQLTAQLAFISFKKLHIVLGVVKDKEVSKILQLLPKDAVYYFTKAQIARALPDYDLFVKAKQYNLNGDHFSNVNYAITSAINNSGKEDVILVCGSVYLVGEVDLNEINRNATD